jgi:photosystem II stability/assembly factor-like uncharacterized protein
MLKIKNDRNFVFGAGFLSLVILFTILTVVDSSEMLNGRKATPESFREYKESVRSDDPSRKPTEWFTIQRAYPFDDIPFESYRQALKQAVDVRNATMSDLEFTATLAGPSNVGGRITALAVHPSDIYTIYAGAALGGVFKSLDGGETWMPISDEVPSLSVGDLAIDPLDPDVLYLGTGEANSSGDSYAGTGLYKTTDGGLSWEFSGLPESYHIGRIAIDPILTNRVYAAVMGKLFNTNPERGVYRSTDSGDSWERVLYISDSTGCIDIVIDPLNTDNIYAAMWERIRHPRYRTVGGLTSGIWKSTDGGDTWNRLSNGLPAPAPDNGRIGLAIAPSNPSILYASYTNHPGYLKGFWRSTDGGDSWESRLTYPDTSDFSSFGWYFGQIWVHPSNPDMIYFGDVSQWKSTNGGSRWSDITGIMHVDMHAMYQHTDDPNYMVVGNDGGVFISMNGGGQWTKCYDLPITQFYAITIDYLTPYRLYGGTQDNSTPGTINGGIDDWEVFFYGDGFYANVDFTNSNVIYAEAQYGYLGKSTDLGHDWDVIFTQYDHGERCNWSTPVVMSPHDNRTLYYGAERVWRTTDGGRNFTAISPDLTGGPGGGNLVFGTITTISPSPLNEDIIWAGTDDSRVWVTTDGGANWDLVSQDLPERWCTRVTADVFEENAAYVSFSGYKVDELVPHIFKTTDYGQTWQDISGNLVDLPVNDILPDPQIPDRLYIGTDFGVYYTDDGGLVWQWMGDGHPICPVMDIELHDGERKLVSGTHGRSMYEFDLTQVGVDDEDRPPIASYRLYQNYPNPFNASTTISFEARKAGRAKVCVYDVNGRLVTELFNGHVGVGKHTMVFNADNLASGIYFVSLKVGNFSDSRKMTLLK